MRLIIAISSVDGTVDITFWKMDGCRLVLWSFKRSRDEQESPFGITPYTYDSEVLTCTLQIAMDVTLGGSTHSLLRREPASTEIHAKFIENSRNG